MPSRRIATPRSVKIGVSAAPALYRVLDSSPSPVVAVDPLGVITYVNPQLGTTFGYERDELLGQPVELLLPSRVSAVHVAHRDDFFANPVARHLGIGRDLAGRRKDGSEFPVEASLSPVETEKGLQVIAQVIDITARKTAEAALLQSQKLESIGRLAGGIAHDFNNLLFAIHGFAELLDQDLGPEADAPLDLDGSRQNVRAILDAAERATRLTAQLLAFSRQQVIRPKVLDINIAIDGLEPMVRQLIGENVRLVLRLDRAAGHLRADPGQLDQILVNLVVNARDAMPGGGTVTIETSNVVLGEPDAIEHVDVTPGPYVLVMVSDTGVGMDRATRERIFDPFFTTKARAKGTGLGLATVYGIVRQAGGHIWPDSEPGHGATFKVYFPRVEAAVEKDGSIPLRAAAPGHGTILVVEDEPAVRDMTTQLLTRAGYKVIAVADGTEAITRVSRLAGSIDVLITDVIMPNMSGIELADWIMDRYPHVGVVLLSAYTAQTLNLDRVMARGAMFVSKPVSSRLLVDTVQQALAVVTRDVVDK